MLSFPRARTISAALRGHDNALGLIRLVLAVAVLVSHTFPLGGFGHDPGDGLTHGQVNLGGLAVAGFFAISGYLITKSGMSADVMQFLWRRALRIFPALLATLLLSAFALGPVIWILDGHSLPSYFVRIAMSPWHYITSNWLLPTVPTYGIRDLFLTTTPYGRSVGGSVINGSIWTLHYEWLCYLLVAVLLVLGILSKARPLVVGVAVIVTAAQIAQVVAPGSLASVPFLGDPFFPGLAYPFVVGAVLAVYSRSIPLSPLLGAAAGAVLVVTMLTGGYAIVGIPAGVYFVLWLGSAIPGRLRLVGQKNDISYGVYLFAFPVQQTLAYAGLYKLGPLPMILGAAAIVFALAWLSWRYVEGPAMSLKGWGPGRGFSYWAERLRRRRPVAAEASPEAAAPAHVANPKTAELSLPLRTAAAEPASPPA